MLCQKCNNGRILIKIILLYLEKKNRGYKGFICYKCGQKDTKSTHFIFYCQKCDSGVCQSCAFEIIKNSRIAFPNLPYLPNQMNNNPYNNINNEIGNDIQNNNNINNGRGNNIPNFIINSENDLYVPYNSRDIGSGNNIPNYNINNGIGIGIPNNNINNNINFTGSIWIRN